MPNPSVQSSSNTTGNSQPVYNQTQSKKGPLAFPIMVDLTVQQSQLIDLATVNDFFTLDFVQTLFVDNRLNAQIVLIENGVSQQTIAVPGHYQGYIPFLCPNPGRFTVTSTGGVVVPLELLNFPVSPGLWPTESSGFLFSDSGALITSDETLAQISIHDDGSTKALMTYDQTVSPLVADLGAGKALNVNIVTGGGGGGVITPSATGEFFTPGNVYTPTSGKKFALYGFQVSVGPRAFDNAGTGGPCEITLTDGVGATIWKGQVYLPAAAPTLTAVGVPVILATVNGIDYVSSTINNQLKVSMTTFLGGSADGVIVDAWIASI